jgi:hypothetical protein
MDLLVGRAQSVAVQFLHPDHRPLVRIEQLVLDDLGRPKQIVGGESACRRAAAVAQPKSVENCIACPCYKRHVLQFITLFVGAEF